MAPQHLAVLGALSLLLLSYPALSCSLPLLLSYLATHTSPNPYTHTLSILPNSPTPTPCPSLLRASVAWCARSVCTSPRRSQPMASRSTRRAFDARTAPRYHDDDDHHRIASLLSLAATHTLPPCHSFIA